jgi:signal transduction histidine kinase
MLAHRIFAADALARLADMLPSHPRPPEFRAALARALRDPRLEIVYWVPESRFGWVEETGWPTRPPTAGPGRAVTDVIIAGRPVAAIVHDAELLSDEPLLHSIAAYAVTVLENQKLIDQLSESLRELTESRARLVTVADDERHRIERDLHDGAQQRLVALQIKLEMLAEEFDVESPGSAARIRALEEEVATTLDEVRRFGRGLYPAVLADRGLSAALHAVARSAAVPTTIDARLPHRYAREVESAVYFVCLEAIQNAAKHGHASRISIAMTGDTYLHFDVRDDGVGFDPSAGPSGAGLTNMRDRVGAVGGTLDVSSAPGRGTRVTGAIPVTG